MSSYQRVMQSELVGAIMETFPGATIKMQEPNSYEIAGIMEAGAVGGEFLDKLGKSDLATLSGDEYLSFIETVVRAYESTCMKLYGDPPCPPV